jgi:CelD/BcsL family acetyltransferase involved in cellulose biosynthesis
MPCDSRPVSPAQLCSYLAESSTRETASRAHSDLAALLCRMRLFHALAVHQPHVLWRSSRCCRCLRLTAPSSTRPQAIAWRALPQNAAMSGAAPCRWCAPRHSKHIAKCQRRLWTSSDRRNRRCGPLWLVAMDSRWHHQRTRGGAECCALCTMFSSMPEV